MDAGRGENLIKRLASAGLSQDPINLYMDTLRLLFAAKLTKNKFEDEIANVLPGNKYHVHNSIVHELLQHAYQKREGVPDVPLLAPIPDKPAAIPESSRTMPNFSCRRAHANFRFNMKAGSSSVPAFVRTHTFQLGEEDALFLDIVRLQSCLRFVLRQQRARGQCADAVRTTQAGLRALCLALLEPRSDGWGARQYVRAGLRALERARSTLYPALVGTIDRVFALGRVQVQVRQVVLDDGGVRATLSNSGDSPVTLCAVRFGTVLAPVRAEIPACHRGLIGYLRGPPRVTVALPPDNAGCIPALEWLLL